MTELIEKTRLAEPFDAGGSNRLVGTRRQAVFSGLIALTLVLGVFAYSLMVSSDDLRVDPASRMLAPSLEHLFGTDLLGRDMLLRTLLALGQSIGIGLFAGIVSTGLCPSFSASSPALIASRTGSSASRQSCFLVFLISCF